MKCTLAKLLTLLLAILCVFTFAACTDDEKGGGNTGGGKPGVETPDDKTTTDDDETPEEPATKYTEGLEFEAIGGGTEYSVYGIGNATDTEIYIPKEYNGKPVTAISDYAFENNSSITFVSIPDTINKIGKKAFSNCFQLENITLPNRKNINETYLENSLLDIFFGCSKLIATERGVTYVGNYAVKCDEDVESAIIRDGTIAIEHEAFLECKNLKSVTIPASLTKIGYKAFYNCEGLEEVHISDLTAWCNINIENIAILGIVNLFDERWSSPLNYANELYLNGELITELIIPDKVKNINSYSFYNCTEIASVTISDSVTEIGRGAFKGCTGLTSMTFGKGLIKTGSDSFDNCSGLKEVHISDIASWCSTDFASNSSSVANPMIYANKLYLNGELITDLVIPEGVTDIGTCAFWYCTSIKSVTIPSTVKKIGWNAFLRCTGVEEVYISDLGAWCNIDFSDRANPLEFAEKLYVNNKLTTEIVIPEGVTSIGSYAFCHCAWITSVKIPNSVKSMGNAFQGCTGLTSVNIPDGVISMDRTFSDCTGLTNVEIPSSVTSIMGAFADCTGLESVKISNGITDITSAFRGCTGLTSFKIPNSVTIMDGAFRDCTGLTNIEIPSSVTSVIGAFAGCTRLESVKISNGITDITAAFQGCTGLTSIEIPNSVTKIGEMTFFGCTGLTSIKIPDSVTIIDYCAFGDCTSLENVIFGENTKIASISDSAFDYDIYNEYDGTYYLGSESNPYLVLIGSDVNVIIHAETKIILDSAFKTDFITMLFDGSREEFEAAQEENGWIFPELVTVIFRGD